jgi:hypothetical protein
MKSRSLLALGTIGLAATLPLAVCAPPATAQVGPEEAHAIGVDAYLYFYPLVTMDLTRRQLTNAVYPLNIGDESGRPLDGTSDYSIHFDEEALPPANAFWSITLYDQQGYQVANGLNRFALSSWMPFEYNPDGSLDLYFQNQSPGADREANWLPAPEGPFNLTMRLYAPKSDALTGKWDPPPVARAQGPSFLQAQ